MAMGEVAGREAQVVDLGDGPMGGAGCWDLDLGVVCA